MRIGKAGHFIGCLNYPECTFTSNFKRNEDGSIELIAAEGPKILQEKCPNCGKPLRSVMGRYGPFVACSGYPECKYIQQTKAGFPCPLDGGDVVKKVWKGKPFWGCVNYPNCKFAVFGDIEEKPCPLCKMPCLQKKYEKDGSITLSCPNKSCTFKEKHEPEQSKN